MKSLWGLLCFVFMLNALPLIADSGHEFDKKEWEEITKNKDYSPKFKEYEPKETVVKEEKDHNVPISALRQLLLLALIVAVIVGIIYFIHVSQQKAAANKKVKNTLTHSIEEQLLEENLPLSDIERLIRDAEKSKDYRRLLRLYYLWVIQTMEKHKHIVWKKEKTNLHYVREVYNKMYYTDFRAITNNLQEFIYGEKVPDETQFEVMKSELLTLKRKINE